MTASVGWWLHAARHNQDRSYCKPATYDHSKSARTGSQQLPGLLDDVLCLILLQLGAHNDFIRVSETCTALRAATNHQELWRALVLRRAYWQRISASTVGDGSQEPALLEFDWQRMFIGAWVHARDSLEEILEPLGEAEPMQSPRRSVEEPGSPRELSAPMRRVADTTVSHHQLCERIEALRECCGVSYQPGDLVEWLGTAAAQRHPLQQLAALGALQGALGEAAAEPLSHLPEGALSARVRLSIFSLAIFSDRHAMRHRARDEMKEVSGSLDELAGDADHPIWQLLERGVVNEVRHIVVGCCDCESRPSWWWRI